VTETAFHQRQMFNQIQKLVYVLKFRFFGSNHWWTEYFDSQPYSTTQPEFMNALRPFCEFDLYTGDGLHVPA
jgi:hypothetical protein